MQAPTNALISRCSARIVVIVAHLSLNITPSRRSWNPRSGLESSFVACQSTTTVTARACTVGPQQDDIILARCDTDNAPKAKRRCVRCRVAVHTPTRRPLDSALDQVWHRWSPDLQVVCAGHDRAGQVLFRALHRTHGQHVAQGARSRRRHVCTTLTRVRNCCGRADAWRAYRRLT